MRGGRSASRGIAHGFGAFRSGLLIGVCLATVAVPLSSAAEMRAYVSGAITAGDVLFNIVRGMAPQEFMVGQDGPSFSIPVLWLCSLLLEVFGSVLLFFPRRDGLETVRLFASGSRGRYWAGKCLRMVAFPFAFLAWQLMWCVTLAVVLGGSPNLLAISADGSALFAEFGSTAWDAGWFMGFMVVDLLSCFVICLAAQLLSVNLGAPVACTCALGYVVVAIFFGSPLLVPNVLMGYRLAGFVGDVGAFMQFIVGAALLAALSVVLFMRLRRRDFV